MVLALFLLLLNLAYKSIQVLISYLLLVLSVEQGVPLSLISWHEEPIQLVDIRLKLRVVRNSLIFGFIILILTAVLK